MPYAVERSDTCPDDRPWGVINTATDETVSCHMNEDAANAHMRALQANVPDAARTAPARSAPEQRTVDVDVDSIDTRGRTLHGYAAVYNVESEDLGGFRERIAPGAFRSVLDGDVRALLNHDPNEVLGRTKSGTLRLFDEQRGLRFEIDLPDSPLGHNVREAVRRGDIDGASFRFVVDRDDWQDELRTIRSVKQLMDVTVATFGAYPAASVELRTRHTSQGEQMAEESNHTENAPQEAAEERVAPPAGSLRVEERAQAPMFRSLAEAFEQRGFGPQGQRATVEWGEFRALSWGGTIDMLSQVTRDGVALGYDQRWAHPAFQSVAVGSDVTSVNVFRQDSRTLPAGTAVVRAIDATTTKPEIATAGTLVTVPLKQVAGVVTGVPNVYLEQAGMATFVETDLRLSINEGLDSLVGTGLSTSGTISKGSSDLVTAIRKGVTAVQAQGYTPNTLLIDAAGAESLDLFRTGGTVFDYAFGAGRFAPSQVFGLNVRVTKAAGTAVVDTDSYGKLYVSPLSLARFEQDAGSTNKSTVRLEGHAAFGTERTAAAARINP